MKMRSEHRMISCVAQRLIPLNWKHNVFNLMGDGIKHLEQKNRIIVLEKSRKEI